MGSRYPLHILTMIKVMVGISLACLLAGLFLPTRVSSLHDFLVGAATGLLIVTFATLLSLHSVTTKDEVRQAESEIETLRIH